MTDQGMMPREEWAQTDDLDRTARLLEERTGISIANLRKAVQTPSKMSARRALRTAVRNIVVERLATQTQLADALECNRRTIARMLFTAW
jgi:hypothetical protein